MNRVDGKFAVVTGASQGLGAAVVRQLALAGAAGIVACDRHADQGHAVADAVRSETGVRTEFVTADLASVADCRKVVAEADRCFGRVHVLVNAAGITDRGNLLNTSEALFDRIFAVNVRAPFFLMQEATKRMVRDGNPGSIVNIGSTSGRTGQPFLAPYAASKGALATLTRNSGYALMRNHIRVNHRTPKWVWRDGLASPRP